MTLGQSHRPLKQSILRGLRFPKTATRIMLGTLAFLTAVALSWFSGQENVTQLFAQLHFLQQNPPFWVRVPDFSNQHLMLPTILLVVGVIGITNISPQPRTWSRTIVVAILLALMLRYMLWRTLSSLNLEDPITGFFSLLLFLLEVVVWVSSGLQLWFMLRIRDRKQQADQAQIAVLDGRFLPSVDILIPTYQEPSFILRRTIIGCQLIDYPKKKVYLLDDSRRPEIKKLAQELGCEYISRSDNRHAKAGNLNHALPKTNGELIAVFDADFVPTSNFLNRVVGFFQDSRVGIVQTPQSFYNPDSVARNLGLEQFITHDEEVFYRQIEAIKDGVESTVCAGTSFVVRRSSLEAVHGFVTESICEDYFTGVNISAKGFQIIYLNEKLSAGLAAEDISACFSQRQRWCQGTLQAFFIKANPLKVAGLKPLQRLAHFEGLISWLGVWSYSYYLLIPIIYTFLNVFPIEVTNKEWFYFFFPYYIVQILVYSWLNYRSRSVFVSLIYQVVFCFPLSLVIFRTLLQPFDRGFRVTQKGLSRSSFRFNWHLACPLIILWMATFLGLVKIVSPALANLPTSLSWLDGGFSLGIFWSLFNLFTISLALLATIDAPKPEIYEWFDIQERVELTSPQQNQQKLPGMTTKLSEAGLEVALTEPLQIDESRSVKVYFPDQEFQVVGRIAAQTLAPESSVIQIRFNQVDLNQYRQLVKLIYSQPGRWTRHQVPGELSALFLLFRALFAPKFLSLLSPQKGSDRKIFLD
ncbi:MAG: glycosyltransferase [Microcoleaceae cyanobacterium]